MNQKDIVSSAVDTLTEKPVTVELDVKSDGIIDRILISIGLKKRKLKYVIKPLRVGNRKRIAARALHIPDDLLKDGLVKALLNPDYTDVCVYAVAVGIQNNRDEPSEELITLVEQFDDSEIDTVLNAVFGSINLPAFINSITLIKGSNVLNVPDPVATNATIPA